MLTENVTVYSTRSTASNQLLSVFEQVAESMSLAGIVKFVKINFDTHADVAGAYGITQMPALFYFKNGQLADKIQGANVAALRGFVEKFSSELQALQPSGRSKSSAAGPSGTSGNNGSDDNWRGAALPRGYGDITSQIELQRSELLNVDSDIGSVRVLFDGSKPSVLSGGKGTIKDWVESDTDEQLMLFMPFQSMLKLHTLQVTYPRVTRFFAEMLTSDITAYFAPAPRRRR